ncbi:hypothetical protein KM043_016814 [Ampulex compressa]|nr:hypothetical protein KM043_016814 [Ampulex compressa]
MIHARCSIPPTFFHADSPLHLTIIAIKLAAMGGTAVHMGRKSVGRVSALFVESPIEAREITVESRAKEFEGSNEQKGLEVSGNALGSNQARQYGMRVPLQNSQFVKAQWCK